jgi:hypothetical protein
MRFLIQSHVIAAPFGSFPVFPVCALTRDSQAVRRTTRCPPSRVRVSRGELIFIYHNGRGRGGTTVDANGNGSIRIQANSPLTNGVHDIKAYAMNSAHVWSAASNDWFIVVNTTTPAKPATPVVTDDHGVVIPSGDRVRHSTSDD